MTPEGLVKKKLSEALKPRASWWFMPIKGASFGANGVPDILCVIDKCPWGFETKARKDQMPTTLQAHNLGLLAQTGIFRIAVVDADNLDGVVMAALRDMPLPLSAHRWKRKTQTGS